MKLNLGCGSHLLDGYVNVDKYEPADVIVDLECKETLHSQQYNGNKWAQFEYWPWPASSVEEVVFHHSLEHMGATVDGFFHVIKELYRVCAAGAKIKIVVPHPRHEDFINDPTHVRIITPAILELFSKKNNEQWAKDGTPNTPLGLQLGVDFEIEKCEAHLDERFRGYPENVIKNKLLECNNVLKQYSIHLKVIK